jgi:glycosyltransferase involved in cell wall biosynthesis
VTRIRIIIFTQQLAAFRSGVGTYAYGLASGLASRGHRVTVIVPEEEKMEMADIRVVGIHRSLFDPTPGGWISLGRSFAGMLTREACFHDIAYFTDAREAWVAKAETIPIVGMVNDSYALDWLRPDYARGIFADYFSRNLYYRLLRLVERRTYSRLEGLIANSYHVAQTICNGYQLKHDLVKVIYLGLPVQATVQQIPIKGQPSVLFAGGNFQRKGLYTLLAAVSLLRNRFPDICVHVVGRDKNQPALEKTARHLGIFNSVVFHGYQPNDLVRGMMAAADMFVLPSLTEGFGLVYLEAMQAGTPVIASSVSGASEVFRNGEEAFFVNPNDIQGLASTIEKIADNPEISARLRRKGLAAASRLTTAKMAAGTEDILLNILAQKK